MGREVSRAVQQHYDNYPYPDYPWFLSGSWAQLGQVDCSNWGLKREVQDIWIAGCGTISALMFGRRNFRSRILATDLSRRSLRKLRWRLALFGVRNVHCLVEDLLETNYQEDFDVVDAYGVLHHLEEPKLGLAKLQQALRPGGIMRLMLYSEEQRQFIEDLRSQVRSKDLQTSAELKTFLQEKGVRLRGDLSSKSGRADALLHPQTKIFSQTDLDELLSEFPRLQRVHQDSSGNHIVFLLKH